MAPRLIPTSVPPGARAAVVVLHGGASRGERAMVSPTQLSVLRMVPIAHHLARRSRRELAVFRLLNSTRGWDTRHTPVDDALWALNQVRDQLGPRVPIGLVGHSLGGRAAILSADEPGVGAVVALAPWLHADDARGLHGSAPVVVVHGTGDRIASPGRSRAVIEGLVRRGRTAGWIGVEGGSHAMLRRHGTFSSLASDVVRATLLGHIVDGAARRALHGEVQQQV